MQILNNLEEDFWLDVTKNCDYATFYHTPAWHHLISESIPGSQIKTIGGTLENGTRFVLPMITTNRIGPFYGLVSSAEDVYGGIIADGPITDAEQNQIYHDVAHKWQVISFRFLPAPYRQLDKEPKDFHTPEVDTTFIIPLTEGFDNISKNFSKSQRSNINKAIKSGVVVEQTNNLDDYKAFYQIYMDSVSRWGDDRIGDVKPWYIFEKAYELKQEMPEAVCLVLHESIQYYAQTDFTYFDLGGSGGNEGAHNFKKRFGGIQQQVNWWFYANPYSTSLHNLRHKLSRG